MRKPKRLETYEPASTIPYGDDGKRICLGKLSDEQYIKALQLGIAQMLSQGELKPEDVGL